MKSRRSIIFSPVYATFLPVASIHNEPLPGYLNPILLRSIDEFWRNSRGTRFCVPPASATRMYSPSIKDWLLLIFIEGSCPVNTVLASAEHSRRVEVSAYNKSGVVDSVELTPNTDKSEPCATHTS